MDGKVFVLALVPGKNADNLTLRSKDFFPNVSSKTATKGNTRLLQVALGRKKNLSVEAVYCLKSS